MRQLEEARASGKEERVVDDLEEYHEPTRVALIIEGSSL
jgi:hypothetical protein